MAVVKLKALLANATVKGHALVQEADLGRARAARAIVHDEELVQQAQDGEAGNEAENRDEQPVTGEPEDDLDIGPVPAVAEVVGEEAPRVVVVLFGEQDAHALLVDGAGVVVVPPDQTEKQGARRGHDGDVGQRPAAVVVGQRVNGLEEEGMAGNGAHGIVGDARGNRAADPCWVGEERIEAAVASLGLVSSAAWGGGLREACVLTSSRSM